MMVVLVFGITLAFELMLGAGLVLSLPNSKHRVWPPPRKGSWQYWYIHFFTESSILFFFTLGFIDWNTFLLKHWLCFVFALPLIALGIMIFLWALRTLTLHTSLGSKGKLIKKGPYQYSRNPQYLGTAIFLSGFMLFFNSFYQFMAGVMGIILFLLTAFVEEDWLKTQYKEEYETYKKEVSRFLFIPIKVRALIFVPLIVLSVVLLFFGLGYLVTLIFEVPFSFSFSLWIRFLGLFPFISGLVLLGWLFKYRKPIDIVISTYVTFLKSVRGVPLANQSERKEPLIIMGPYKYVRHPLYLGVFLLAVGGWMLLDYSFMLFGAFFILLWFRFVVIPFEEKELVAIFGLQYEHYIKGVSRIIPLPKCTKCT
jgi:protein-S-isoprenylcysteine O-methyltransferase Ste14